MRKQKYWLSERKLLHLQLRLCIWLWWSWTNLFSSAGWHWMDWTFIIVCVLLSCTAAAYASCSWLGVVALLTAELHMPTCISLTEVELKGRLRWKDGAESLDGGLCTYEWKCLKTRTQNKWRAAILCHVLWTFQHSLHMTMLKGLLSKELPHQHSWLTLSLWHINMHRGRTAVHFCVQMH